MSIPKTVQRQLDEANAIQAQANAQPQVQLDVVTNASQFETPPPAVEAPPPAPVPAPQSVDWEQKFRTVQGMMNSRVAELTAQNKAYESQLGLLQRQVTDLTEAVKTRKPEAEKPSMDPRDVEKFGGDLVEMVQRQTTQHLNTLSDRLGQMAERIEQRVSALEGQVNGTKEQVALSQEQQFYVILDQAVPDWRAINENEAFLDWLAVQDEVYGVPRQTALNHAYGRLDAKRVVAIFTQFKSGRAAAPSAANQVTPRSTPSPQPTPQPAQAKKFVSQRFIEQFYLDQARGRHASDPARYAAVEAEINLAVAENRVAP